MSNHSRIPDGESNKWFTPKDDSVSLHPTILVNLSSEPAGLFGVLASAQAIPRDKNVKRNLLRDHIGNEKFHDTPGVVIPTDGGRLGNFFFELSGGWETVARLVRSSAGNSVSWFPDTNIAILPDTSAVWTAFRLAALGANSTHTVLTPVVQGELEDWLDSPYRNTERSKAIRDSRAQERGWVRSYEFDLTKSLGKAVLGYTRLLGFRRTLATPAEDGTTMLDTDPNDKSASMSAIQKHLGERAVQLAKKGRADLEDTGTVSLDDELHCLMAIAHALETGRESVILTADEDLAEIFWKSQNMIDMHYRAWLAAPAIADGFYGPPDRVFEDCKTYFHGSLTLYNRPTGHLIEVLPTLFTPVPVSLVYVAPNGEIRVHRFVFEREMIGMLEMRGLTGGRCTDLFGDCNIHIHLATLPKDWGLDKNYFGVGKDRGDATEFCGAPVFLSCIDVTHVINCLERVSPRKMRINTD